MCAFEEIKNAVKAVATKQTEMLERSFMLFILTTLGVRSWTNPIPEALRLCKGGEGGVRYAAARTTRRVVNSVQKWSKVVK